MIDFLAWRPTAAQKQAATTSLIFMLVVSAVSTPFAGFAGPQLPVAIAAIFGVICFASAITAALFFSQYRTTHATPLGILGLAYAYLAFTQLVYVLTYPGVFGPLGMPGSHRSTSSWIYYLTRLGFASLIMLYAWSRRAFADPQKRDGPAFLSRLIVGFSTFTLAAIATTFVFDLPPTFLNGAWTPTMRFGLLPLTTLSLLAAIAVLVRFTKRETIVDLWLSVALTASIIDMYLTFLGVNAYTLGWWFARVAIFVSSTSILVIFLYQIDRMYGQLNTMARRLSEQALVDGLTGIANRRAFDQYAATALRMALRHNQDIAVMIIDIDHFKMYNDTFGHLAGDDCLRRVAATINAQIGRPSDFAARYGGEEFVVVLIDIDRAGAAIVAERIRVAILAEAIPHAPQAGLFVTASLGACMLHDGRATAEDLIGCADAALYQAKAQGRNRVVLADAGHAAART